MTIDSAIVLTALCSRHNQLDSSLHHTNSSRFHDHLKNLEHFASKPLSGYRFAIIKETIGALAWEYFSRKKLINFLCLVATGLGVQHDVVQRVLEAAAKIERLARFGFHRLSVPPKTHCMKAAVDFVSVRLST